MTSEAFLTFLAYSTELERDARERYVEIAESLAVHHNDEVSSFFSRMAAEAEAHLADVDRLAGGSDLPAIQAWDFDWPEPEPPETTSYEALHYRMSLAEAIRLALANERAAEAFYRDYALSSTDPEVVRVAGEFADEEAQHARALELLLRDVPRDSRLDRHDDDPPVMPE